MKRRRPSAESLFTVFASIVAGILVVTAMLFIGAKLLFA